MIAAGRARMAIARHDLAEALTQLHAARVAWAAGPDRIDQRALAEVDLLEGDVLQMRNDPAGARTLWLSAQQRVEASPVARTEPMLLLLRAAALVRLGQPAEAAPLVRRLEQTGFRHPWLTTLRGLASEHPPQLVSNMRR